MEAFRSKAEGVPLLIGVVFGLVAIGLLSVGVSLAELTVGCLQLTRLRGLGGEADALAVSAYLIVSGLVGFFGATTNGACLRGRQCQDPRDRHLLQPRRRRRRWRRPRCRDCLYVAGSLGHVFSLAWLGAGFYWVYWHRATSVASVAVEAVNSTTSAASISAMSSAVRSSALAARPLLWLRLSVCLLELAIVVAMVTCCRCAGGDDDDKVRSHLALDEAQAAVAAEAAVAEAETDAACASDGCVDGGGGDRGDV